MKELAACFVSEISTTTLRDFHRLASALEATQSLREAARVFGEHEPLSALLENPEARQRAHDLHSLCRDQNIQILYPGHEKYPPAFLDLPQPPLFLTVIGEITSAPKLSIVGSREPSRLAVDWMREHMPIFHRENDVVVVSGGARGVDQLSHISAIEAEKPTIIFNPAGILQLYPRDVNAWRDIIIRGGGAIVSEFHPSAEMRKYFFLRRNRLIAALSRLTFVVEARRQSGSLLTARTSIELHREICVLPGSPLHPSSLGSTDLMFDGAQPIRDAHDLSQFWKLCRPLEGEPSSPATAKCEKSRDSEDGISEPDRGDHRHHHVLR